MLSFTYIVIVDSRSHHERLAVNEDIGYHKKNN
jgi:hypothetical protein